MIDFFYRETLSQRSEWTASAFVAEMVINFNDYVERDSYRKLKQTTIKEK
jgi:hypothetical protein